jgi:hypothetical protein
MRCFAVSISFALLLSPFVVEPTSAQTQPSAQGPQRDPQAVAVLTKVLTTAGGLAAVSSIQDVTGTGNISYNQPPGVAGSVTIRGKGIDQFRLDVKLSAETRSEAMSSGQMTITMQDGSIGQPSAQSPTCPSRLALPYLLLSSALSSPSWFSLAYKGIVEIDGHSVYDIQLQQVLPGLVSSGDLFPGYNTVDFFVDTTSLQVNMMQDTVPRNVVRQFRYSDYRAVNGIPIPFSIAEQSGGLEVWTIQLGQVSFNTGLQDADFKL